MNKKVFVLGMLMVLIIAMVTVVAASPDDFEPEDPQIQAQEEVVIKHQIPEERKESTESYWTEERLSEVLPVDFFLNETNQGEFVNFDEEVLQGEPINIEGSLPDSGADAWAREMFPEEWERTDSLEDDTPGLEPALEQTQGITDYSYPFPYNPAYYVPFKLRNDYPHRTVGLLLFTIPGYGDYFCSASVMVNRALWTAGHCVYTPGIGWHENVAFIPAYRNGSMPYGLWSANNLFSLTGWTYDGNFAYDIGSVILNDKNGWMVGHVTGWLGASFNGASKRHWHSFGYPVNIGGGDFPVTCQGSRAGRDAVSGPDTIVMGCNMLGGSSGGPILYRYAPVGSGGKNYVNGVNSYGYQNQPNGMYFAYFGEGAKNIYYASLNE